MIAGVAVICRSISRREVTLAGHVVPSVGGGGLLEATGRSAERSTGVCWDCKLQQTPQPVTGLTTALVSVAYCFELHSGHDSPSWCQWGGGGRGGEREKEIERKKDVCHTVFEKRKAIKGHLQCEESRELSWVSYNLFNQKRFTASEGRIYIEDTIELSKT